MMDTKDEIMNATFRLFAEKGYNTSMSDIAKQVGIKVPSLYSHFGSKDEIIDLVMIKEITSFYDNIIFQINILNKANETCEMKIKTFCFSIFTYFSKSERIRFWKGISTISHNELREKARELIKQNEIEIAMLLKNVFIEGKSKGEIKYESLEGSINLFQVIIHGVLEWILIDKDMKLGLDYYKKTIWQAYWDGIKA